MGDLVLAYVLFYIQDSKPQVGKIFYNYMDAQQAKRELLQNTNITNVEVLERSIL